MTLPVLILLVGFIVLLMMDVPVAFSIGISTTLAFLAMDDVPAFLLVAHRMATAIDGFALLAIPFFILSGQIMERGGIARKLVDAAEVLVGRLPGGLAIVNVMTCMLFGSISGSAAAAVSSIGGFMVPAMNEKGYDRGFNGAPTTCAATTGLLIPPSNIMIIYAMATGGKVSIAAVFMAGIVPGVLVGLALMIVAGVLSGVRGYGRGAAETKEGGLKRLLGAIPALFLVVLVLGGILGGVFTATEASAIAVLYSLLLTVVIERSLSLRELPQLFLQAGLTTGVVMLLIASSMAMSWLLAYERVPAQLASALLSISDNPIIVLLVINAMLLAVGTFMDMTPAVLVFTPILLPVVTDLGMAPTHFGIVLIMNLCMGLCTPPVGTCLFLGCGIAEVPMTRMVRELIPFLIAMIAVLLLTTFVPVLSMGLPKALGL